MKFDFETWLIQTYDLKPMDLDKKALGMAKREYKEEYPPEGETRMELKTYPFKKYLDSMKR